MSTPKDKTKIVFLETNLTELGAFALERRYIKWYGRKDQCNGILLNQTNGGEGASGIIPWNKNLELTDTHRANISISLRGHTKGIPKSIEQRKKQAKSMKGKNVGPKPQITCPYCNTVGGLPQMKQWHFEKANNSLLSTGNSYYQKMVNIVFHSHCMFRYTRIGHSCN